MFNCDVCEGEFKLIQEREEEQKEMVRFVLYYTCDGCRAGLIYYHPFAPKTDSTPNEDDESSKGDASE